jgi:hypothetical protein
LTNPKSATVVFPISLRKYGYGIVRCGATAVTDPSIHVGDLLIIRTGVAYAVGAAITASGLYGRIVGIAMATGTAVNLGDTILVSPASGQINNMLINCMINC